MSRRFVLESPAARYASSSFLYGENGAIVSSFMQIGLRSAEVMDGSSG